MQTGKQLLETETHVSHSKAITSLSKSQDGSHFITGSIDKAAKVSAAAPLGTPLHQQPLIPPKARPLMPAVQYSSRAHLRVDAPLPVAQPRMPPPGAFATGTSGCATVRGGHGAMGPPG